MSESMMEQERKLRVLIVDDEEDVVDFLKRFLRRFQVQVYTASGGEAALRLYEQKKPQWVFLDIQMADKDGIAVLKELRRRDSACRVIMITGKDDKKTQDHAKRLGALDYILKPLDLVELRKTIQRRLFEE